MAKTLTECRAEVVSAIDNYNQLLEAKSFDKLEDAENKIKEAEAEHNAQKRADVFAELKSTENPVLEAVKMLHYPIISHKVVREDGETIAILLDETKTKRIDLVKFFNSMKKPIAWYYRLERFNQLLALKAAEDLDTTADNKKLIREKFDMSEKAGKVNVDKKNPTSNTQLTKLLQSVVDEVVFVDNGKGINVIRITNPDMQYFIKTQTQKDRKDYCAVKVAKSREVQGILLEVMHKIYTEKSYKVNVPQAKESTDESKSEPKKSTAKAKKPETKKAEKAAAAEEIAVKKTA